MLIELPDRLLSVKAAAMLSSEKVATLTSAASALDDALDWAVLVEESI